jgi:hypothetical protein
MDTFEQATRKIEDEETEKAREARVPPAERARNALRAYVASREQEAGTLDPAEQDRLSRMRNKPEYTDAFQRAFAEESARLGRRSYDTATEQARGLPNPAVGGEARRSASYSPTVSPDAPSLLEGAADPLDQTRWPGREEGHLGDARDAAAEMARKEALEAARYQHLRSLKQK